MPITDYVSDGTGTEYSLSEAGAAPEPVVGALCEWGKAYDANA
ncbi:MAG: winged helix-turn-helix transcriptional regulator [Lachnospiraceae bacterium]|nr:winged helix-turn-helix transcriptional regulator [Lachnospiraceae bacterium]